MAKPGPKPKPYLLKVQEGNPGRRALDPGVEPPEGDFEPAFPISGFALQEWKRIRAEAPWVKASDNYALTDRCRCAQILQEAEDDIAKKGYTVETRNGDVMNPAIRVAKQYRPAVQKYDVELGLTSSSRTRVDGEPASKIDPLEAALCG